MKKWLALVLAAVMMLAMSAACAKTVEPEETEIEHIAGKTVHATVGAYSSEFRRGAVKNSTHSGGGSDGPPPFFFGETVARGRREMVQFP